VKHARDCPARSRAQPTDGCHGRIGVDPRGRCARLARSVLRGGCKPQSPSSGLEAASIPIIAGPAPRTSALGPMTSIYCEVPERQSGSGRHLWEGSGSLKGLRVILAGHSVAGDCGGEEGRLFNARAFPPRGVSRGRPLVRGNRARAPSVRLFAACRTRARRLRDSSWSWA
jgi:hypothetical protein